VEPATLPPASKDTCGWPHWAALPLLAKRAGRRPSVVRRVNGHEGIYERHGAPLSTWLGTARHGAPTQRRRGRVAGLCAARASAAPPAAAM
jgi:hypothetical protein